MLQELILCKSSSPYKRKADLKAGGSFDLDSPINFAVMKRLKLKYGLWNYCKIKIREKSSSDATNKLMLHLQMVGKNLLDFPGIVSSNNYQKWLFSLILDKKEQELLITLMILNNLIKNIKDEK
jgi:hypothetical protein